MKLSRAKTRILVAVVFMSLIVESGLCQSDNDYDRVLDRVFKVTTSSKSERPQSEIRIRYLGGVEQQILIRKFAPDGGKCSGQRSWVSYLSTE